MNVMKAYKNFRVTHESLRFELKPNSSDINPAFYAGYESAINSMIEANKMPLADNSALIREIIAAKGHNATSAARAIGINPRNMRKYCNGMACSGLIVFLLENMQIKD